MPYQPESASTLHVKPLKVSSVTLEPVMNSLKKRVLSKCEPAVAFVLQRNHFPGITAVELTGVGQHVGGREALLQLPV